VNDPALGSRQKDSQARAGQRQIPTTWLPRAVVVKLRGLPAIPRWNQGDAGSRTALCCPEIREYTNLANTQGPFGFVQWGTASGPPNFAEGHNPPYRIASGYATAIFKGDAVRMNASATGYIEQWANGDGGTATNILVGIFNGCAYFSTSQQKMVWSPYWPGSDATGDVDAFVIDDPNAQFKVQAGIASAITQTSIGRVADIVATPVGNTTTGQSGMSLSTPTTTVTLPFKVVNVITTPPGAQGTDLTTAYNYVIVAFNNQQYKALLGV
jgi:hypothetical protein